MNTFGRKASTAVTLGGIVFACFAAAGRAHGPDDSVLLGLAHGSVSFEVGTNVPALRIHGRSNEITARARLGAAPNGVVLQEIEGRVPVRSIGTGLALRDEHMRKYIFTTPDGQTPDLHFAGERTECAAKEAGGHSSCAVSGELTIRGTARPVIVSLIITDENGVVRVFGNATIKLSSYGIDQPSQLGVRTTDEVRLKLELTARRSGQAALTSAGAR